MNPYRRRPTSSLLVFLPYYPVFPALTSKLSQFPCRKMEFLCPPRMSPVEAAFHHCAPCYGESLLHLLTIQPTSSEEECFSYRGLEPQKAHEKGSQTRQEVSCSARSRDGGLPSVGCGWTRPIKVMEHALVPSFCLDPRKHSKILIACCVQFSGVADLISSGTSRSLSLVDTSA
jgi:hypothetical protein